MKAVDGVTFDVAPNETIALVGESGCGKTTTGRAILRLLEPTSGEVWFRSRRHGEPIDLCGLSLRAMRPYRSELQIVFQDPFASLNPRITVGNALREALVIHGVRGRSELDDRVAELMRHVGLRPELSNRFPHEFSGGQRQRVGIARALAVEPRLIVCDEAVSALDVSIQAQIINLLADLQAELGLSYVFIAHDLAVVRHLAHRVAVMYLGRIVELGSTGQIFENPRHPYTQALLSAIPVPDPARRAQRIPLEGDVPSPADPPRGCHFHTRCPVAEEGCAVEYPTPVEVGPGHTAACHLLE